LLIETKAKALAKRVFTMEKQQVPNPKQVNISEIKDQST
jgi:hypothetical protein